jgi:hypothetical protein
MRFTNKILFAEKIATIDFAKIIHRVIISIDFRVPHTIFITAAPTVINPASRLLTAFSSSLYLTNSKEKIVS